MTSEKDTKPPQAGTTREFWRETARTLVQGSISTIEEAAKQIIAVAAILEVLYFHAITFSDVRGKIGSVPTIVYSLPLVCWLVSLIFSVLVFLPRTYSVNVNSWRTSKSTYSRIVKAKHSLLIASMLFLFLGGIALFAALGAYLAG